MALLRTLDFGELIPGISGLLAIGSGQLDSLPLSKKVNVFSTVPNGTSAVLPSFYAPGAEILIMNRGLNALNLWPARGDLIEGHEIDTPVAVPPNWNINLVSFDPQLSRTPRTWWVCYFLSVILNSGLSNDGGWLLTSDSSYPTSAVGLLPGSIWSNGGSVTVVPGVSPDPFASALFFGSISSAQLLVTGGGNLPLANPGVPNQLWNSGGTVSVS